MGKSKKTPGKIKKSPVISSVATVQPDKGCLAQTKWIGVTQLNLKTGKWWHFKKRKPNICIEECFVINHDVLFKHIQNLKGKTSEVTKSVDAGLAGTSAQKSVSSSETQHKPINNKSGDTLSNDTSPVKTITAVALQIGQQRNLGSNSPTKSIDSTVEVNFSPTKAIDHLTTSPTNLTIDDLTPNNSPKKPTIDDLTLDTSPTNSSVDDLTPSNSPTKAINDLTLNTSPTRAIDHLTTSPAKSTTDLTTKINQNSYSNLTLWGKVIDINKFSNAKILLRKCLFPEPVTEATSPSSSSLAIDSNFQPEEVDESQLQLISLSSSSPSAISNSDLELSTKHHKSISNVEEWIIKTHPAAVERPVQEFSKSISEESVQEFSKSYSEESVTQSPVLPAEGSESIDYSINYGGEIYDDLDYEPEDDIYNFALQIGQQGNRTVDSTTNLPTKAIDSTVDGHFNLDQNLNTESSQEMEENVISETPKMKDDIDVPREVIIQEKETLSTNPIQKSCIDTTAKPISEEVIRMPVHKMPKIPKKPSATNSKSLLEKSSSPGSSNNSDEFLRLKNVWKTISETNDDNNQTSKPKEKSSKSKSRNKSAINSTATIRNKSPVNSTTTIRNKSPINSTMTIRNKSPVNFTATSHSRNIHFADALNKVDNKKVSKKSQDLNPVNEKLQTKSSKTASPNSSNIVRKVMCEDKLDSDCVKKKCLVTVTQNQNEIKSNKSIANSNSNCDKDNSNNISNRNVVSSQCQNEKPNISSNTNYDEDIELEVHPQSSDQIDDDLLGKFASPNNTFALNGKPYWSKDRNISNTPKPRNYCPNFIKTKQCLDDTCRMIHCQPPEIFLLKDFLSKVDTFIDSRNLKEALNELRSNEIKLDTEVFASLCLKIAKKACETNQTIFFKELLGFIGNYELLIVQPNFASELFTFCKYPSESRPIFQRFLGMLLKNSVVISEQAMAVLRSASQSNNNTDWRMLLKITHYAIFNCKHEPEIGLMDEALDAAHKYPNIATLIADVLLLMGCSDLRKLDVQKLEKLKFLLHQYKKTQWANNLHSHIENSFIKYRSPLRNCLLPDAVLLQRQIIPPFIQSTANMYGRPSPLLPDPVLFPTPVTPPILPPITLAIPIPHQQQQQQMPCHSMNHISISDLCLEYVRNESWLELAALFNTQCVVQQRKIVLRAIHNALCSVVTLMDAWFSCFLVNLEKFPIGTEEYNFQLYLLGQIGMSLLLHAYGEKNNRIAFNILETLHNHNINYYHLQKAALNQRDIASIKIPPFVILTAAKLCLIVVNICIVAEKPFSAFQVFKDCEFAKPTEEVVAAVSADEHRLRHSTLMKLSFKLKQCSLLIQGVEVLEEILKTPGKDEESIEVMLELTELYNDYMVILINISEINLCLTLVSYVQNRTVKLNIFHSVWRGFIICCFKADRKKEAICYMRQCILRGIYKQQEDPESYPRVLTLESNLTYEEIAINLYIYFEEITKIVNKLTGVFNDRFSLTIVFEENIPDDLNGVKTLMDTNPTYQSAFERLRTVLSHEFQNMFDFEEKRINNILALRFDPMSLYQYCLKKTPISNKATNALNSKADCSQKSSSTVTDSSVSSSKSESPRRVQLLMDQCAQNNYSRSKIVEKNVSKNTLNNTLNRDDYDRQLPDTSIQSPVTDLRTNLNMNKLIESAKKQFELSPSRVFNQNRDLNNPQLFEQESPFQISFSNEKRSTDMVIQGRPFGNFAGPSNVQGQLFGNFTGPSNVQGQSFHNFEEQSFDNVPVQPLDICTEQSFDNAPGQIIDNFGEESSDNCQEQSVDNCTGQLFDENAMEGQSKIFAGPSKRDSDSKPFIRPQKLSDATRKTYMGWTRNSKNQILRTPLKCRSQRNSIERITNLSVPKSIQPKMELKQRDLPDQSYSSKFNITSPLNCLDSSSTSSSLTTVNLSSNIDPFVQPTLKNEPQNSTAQPKKYIKRRNFLLQKVETESSTTKQPELRKVISLAIPSITKKTTIPGNKITMDKNSIVKINQFILVELKRKGIYSNNEANTKMNELREKFLDSIDDRTSLNSAIMKKLCAFVKSI